MSATVPLRELRYDPNIACATHGDIDFGIRMAADARYVWKTTHHGTARQAIFGEARG
jgi:hypothetical protein